jgi:hypothetical protein
MTVALLLAELARRGIILEAKGDRLRYKPKAAMTPHLADRLAAHKAELLAMLASTEQQPPLTSLSAVYVYGFPGFPGENKEPVDVDSVDTQKTWACLPPDAELPHHLADGESGASVDPADATGLWLATLERLAGHPDYPPELLAGLRTGEARWVDDPETDPLGPDGWPANSIDPDELAPCPICGSLEQWESAGSGSAGWGPGTWRCLKCDPPTKARQWRERAARLKTGPPASPGTHEEGR